MPAEVSWPRSSSDKGAFSSTVSVVIPARDEEENIPFVLKGIPAWVYEIVLVDGNSLDRTVEVAKSYCQSIKVVAQPGKGKGDALRAGFRSCEGDIIVAMDADGSMDPAEMSTFISAIEKGHDLVKGSRALPGGGSSDLTTFRKLGNWGLRTLANILYRSRFTELCYGYFAFRRGTVDELELGSDGFEIETEIFVKAHRAGLRVMEVPSYESPRANGVSNLSPLRDGWRILMTLIRSRFSRISAALPGTTRGRTVASTLPEASDGFK